MELDFKALDASLLSRAEDVFFSFFPGAVRRGVELCIGSLKAEPGESLKFNMQSGVWKDFQSLDGGAGFISLWAAKEAITQGEAYKQLDRQYGKGGPIVPSRSPFQPDFKLMPVPDHASREISAFEHSKHGLPSAVHYYTNLDGELLCVHARYEQGAGKKQFCPWIWKADAWRPEAPPAPRPLYGLLHVAAQPNVKVIIVEGEKTADALQALVNQPVVTWMMGAMATRKADWSPLRGRKVLIWPDADEAGQKAAQSVCGVLLGLSCQIEIVDVSGQPEGWDAADGGWRTTAELAGWLKGRIRPVRTAPPQPANTPADVSDAPPVAVSSIWQRANLHTNAKGVPFPNDHTMSQLLEYAQHMTGSIELWWDEFLCRICYEKDGETREWSDTETFNLLVWVQSQCGIPKMSVQVVQRCIETYARRHARNCVTDWLKGLAWDGVDRLPQLISRGFGAIESPYHSDVGRCFLVGMVARAMRPGCKVDTMPVFEGRQGLFKSSALKALCGAQWFAEVHESILTKDFMLSIQGKWLCEISELHAFRKSDMTAIKGRISDACDRFRSPYGHYSRDWPRQGVFAGTTNDDDWNTDPTGARRFWPVECGQINLDWIRENRAALFAEALARFQRGELWHDVDARQAEHKQNERRPDDPWLGKIEAYLAGRSVALMADVLSNALEFKVDRMDLPTTRRVGVCLRYLGYRPKTTRIEGKPVKAWVTLNSEQDAVLTEQGRLELEQASIESF